MEVKKMSNSDIEFATAQILLNTLYGNDKLIIYENPLQKIGELCDKTKEIVRNINSDPSSFSNNTTYPFQEIMKYELLLDVYDKNATGRWKVAKKLTEKEKDQIIKSILNKIKIDGERKKFITKELKKENDSEHFDRMLKMRNQELDDYLNEWSGFKMKKFDAFEQKPSQKEIPAFEVYRTQIFLEPYVNKKTLELRNAYSKKILMLLKDNKKYRLNNYLHDKGYVGGYTKSYPPPENYIYEKLLPWIIYNTCGYKKLADIDEEKCYEKFITEFEQFAKKVKK